jgi:ferredoxin-NADP reductase
MNQPQQFTVPFVKKEQVAKDTYTFYFDRTKANYDFIAGQYNTITLPHENPDGRGIKRFFSVSSSPNNKEFLTITTKVTSNSSFKKKLLSLQAGELVFFEGPRGHFILKETDAEYVFLVGGIGVTPLMSILHFLDEEKLPTKITLLASFSTREELVHYKEFKEIESRNSDVKIVYTITQEEDLENWDGETGRISKEMIQQYVPDFLKPYYYVVGPPAMVEGMMTLVQELGIPQERIVKENFTGY